MKLLMIGMDGAHIAAFQRGWTPFQPKARRKQLISSVIRVAKKLISYSLCLKLRQNATVNKSWATISTTPPPDARAFSSILGSWRHGIFVNDTARFSGAVDPVPIASVTQEVIDVINGDPEARKHGVSASPRHDNLNTGAPQYPDIVLSMPDSVVSSTSSGTAFAPFQTSTGPLGLKTVTNGVLLTVKSSQALAAHTTCSWDFKNPDDKTDLTAVYAHILKRLGAE
jgi:hypothetical protein